MTSVFPTDGYVYQLLKFDVKTEELLEEITLDSVSIRMLSYFRYADLAEEFGTNDCIDLQYSADLRFVYEVHRCSGDSK